jgi:hypothetical protein
VHVCDKHQALGSYRKQLWQHFRDCDDVARVHHLDERTSHWASHGKNRLAANPSFQQLVLEVEKLRSFFAP